MTIPLCEICQLPHSVFLSRKFPSFLALFRVDHLRWWDVEYGYVVMIFDIAIIELLIESDSSREIRRSVCEALECRPDPRFK